MARKKSSANDKEDTPKPKMQIDVEEMPATHAWIDQAGLIQRKKAGLQDLEDLEATVAKKSTFEHAEQKLNGETTFSTIPEEYDSWSNLRQFIVYENALTGTIPPSYFESWTDIREYDFTGNSIEGTNATDLVLLPFYNKD